MKKFVSLLVLLSLLWVWPQSSFAHEVCFPNDKTIFCLRDPFSDYWEQNGGLPVFGYPVTDRFDEQNPDTGEVYPTQWLERNRFEYHAENEGTPYVVLLGLLGKERLAQLNRDWASEPRESGPKDGCLWFDQTGHNVCNQSGNLGFKTYWESNGLQIPGLDSYARSLQLFGLPLTEPKMETNSSGDTVLTQWFERARFEWHPNNPDQFKVLLGLLGSEVRANAGPMPMPVPPVPTPQPSPIPIPEPEPTPAAPPPSFNNCDEDETNTPEWPVRIVTVDKRAETVTIRNVSSSVVDLSSWRICSMRGNQLHATLSGSIQAGQTLTIASQASGPIWSNSDTDDGLLYDAQGRAISYWDDED